MRNFIIHSCLWTLLLLLSSCDHSQEIVSSSGQIYVTTIPTGAMVFIDGVPAAQTPTTLTRVLPGDHLLFMRKAGYHEARTTITTRPGERIAVDIKLEPLRGMLLIHSSPEGATIEINDANYGKTPLLITDFPLGKHRMRLSAQDHLSRVLDVTVPDQTPQKIDVLLVPDSAQIIISSTPTGARVTIDGAVREKTPCTIPSIPSGIHKMDLTLKGYQPHSESFSVKAGDSKKISATLVPLPAKLSVVSIPEKARIYLNNQFKAVTPFSTDHIPPGQYVLRAELQGYETQIRTNTVEFGKKSVVEFHMVKNSGAILISTEPPGISIYLDGEDHGITKTHGRKLISAQLQIELVPKGQHKLQLTKEGYYDLTKIVDVKPNQTIIIHEKLQQRPVPFVPNVVIRTGPGAEHSFKGIIREEYENGDIELEIEPGILIKFRASEILSTKPIPQK